MRGNEAVVIPAFVPGQQSGGREGLYEHVLIVRWPEWVRATVVEEALRWLEREFVGEPALPREAAA